MRLGHFSVQPFHSQRQTRGSNGTQAPNHRKFVIVALRDRHGDLVVSSKIEERD